MRRTAGEILTSWEEVAITSSGAQERTRTFTAVKPLAPEASASTNSATWALGRLLLIVRALVKLVPCPDSDADAAGIACTARD